MRQKYFPKLLFLCGPTAVGKSEIAAIIAKKLNGEIISCDSMQIYKGMDILTSQPAQALRKKAAHHLIAVISPCAEYDASKYCRLATNKISEIVKKGKTPLVTGGTGLYMSLLVDGIFKNKPDEAIRRRLYESAQKHGAAPLYKKLSEVDPEAAGKIHPNDTRRIVRALEVFESTGKPISLLQKTRKGLKDKYDIRIFCLNMPRQALYKRIEGRVEKMFDQGLVEEARRLLRKNLSTTAYRAIGIREIEGHLNGAYDLNTAKQMIARNSCLYAKRQLTWFRKDKRIKWINLETEYNPRGIAQKIWKEFSL